MTQTIHVTEHLTPCTLCAFIDGELATSSYRTIQQHLTFCHSCTLRALSATQLKAAIGQYGVRLIPCAFDSSGWDRIPENDPVGSDNQATVLAALKQIRTPFREPLLLCDVEAVNYQDIGAILDIPVEIVMSRISIARDTISQILQLQSGESQ
jgi:DNA-directed RNA polymerase specialized sigma24 family protein